MGFALPFPAICQAHGLPVPVAEFRFAPPRRWRFDWVWLEQRLAVEIQGGLYTRGRHTRGPALVNEYAKLNAAVIAGWRVLLVTPAQVRSGEACELVKRAMG